MFISNSFEMDAPVAEARAFFVLRKPEGELSFMGATEIFAGRLDDVLSYVWNFPDATRQYVYIESETVTFEPEQIEAMRSVRAARARA